MLTMEVLLGFMLACVLLDLAPGPDNLFVLSQSAMHGPVAGMVVTLGLATGLLVHTLAVALGVAVVFQTSALAFAGLKLLGAAYLLYLAWQAFRAGSRRQSGAGVMTIYLPGLYRRGILMSLSNPKLSIFFLAFLPQFADPERGDLTLQLLLLGTIFILLAMLIFCCISLLAGTLGQWLGRSRRAQYVMNRLTAMLFAGLALRLLVAQR